MHKVESLKPHLYRNKRRAAGDNYEVDTQQQLRLMKALGWVKSAPLEIPIAQLPSFSGSYQTRVMTAEVEVKPKRTYTRRIKIEEPPSE